MITETNKDYDSIFNPIIYHISGVSTGVSELQILANDDLIGTKRLSGYDQYDVNVARYLHGSFSITPMDGGSLLRRGVGRSVKCSVACGADYSASRIYVASTKAVVPQTWLTASTKKRLKAGEIDECSFVIDRTQDLFAKVEIVTTQGLYFTYDSSVINMSPGVVILTVEARVIDNFMRSLTNVKLTYANVYSITVTIKATSGKFMPTLTWEADHVSAGARVTWINRYGMIDNYTFIGDHTSQEKTKRELTQLYNGTIQLSAQTTIEHTVFSSHEGTAILSWLAEIVSSPTVWVNGIRVVVSQDTVPIKSEALTSVELKYTENSTIQSSVI